MATSSKEKVDLAKDYSIGSLVSCEICNKEICRGNVLAYDNPFRTIMIGIFNELEMFLILVTLHSFTCREPRDRQSTYCQCGECYH